MWGSVGIGVWKCVWVWESKGRCKRVYGMSVGKCVGSEGRGKGRCGGVKKCGRVHEVSVEGVVKVLGCEGSEERCGERCGVR